MKRLCASIVAAGLLLVIAACHHSNYWVLAPDVVGLTPAAATTKLKTYGLVVGTQSTASSATVPSGEIVSQSPAAGISVAPGSAINVVVSTGPAAATVAQAAAVTAATAAAATPLSAGAVDASTAGTVHALTSSSYVAAPSGGLTLGADGNYYGVSARGGANHGLGVFFRITPGGARANLYSFGSRADDAVGPDAALIEGIDGNFYGTSSAGGSFGAGTVYRISPAGVETVLYSFAAGGAGSAANPAGGLVQGADGNFYGTTRAGGANGSGVVFRLTLAGTFSVLSSLGAAAGEGG